MLAVETYRSRGMLTSMEETGDRVGIGSQGALARAMITIHVEAQRGDAYKKVYDESEKLVTRLRQEMQHRVQLEKRNASLEQQLIQLGSCSTQQAAPAWAPQPSR